MNAAELKTMAKKQPISVACGVVALVCGVLLYLTSGTVEENRNIYDQKASTARTILTNVSNSLGLAQQTESVQQSVKEVSKRLIRANQLAINLQHFYRLESETGVKLVDVHQGGAGLPRAGSGKANYTAIPFAVNIQGNFMQVLDFLRRIENGQRIARFTSVSFAKAGGDNIAPDQFSISMGIEFLGTP